MSPSKTPPHKLVSLRHISRLERLTSSDSFEVAMVGGWPIVVPWGQFFLNQMVLYFEIDSFLPFDDNRFVPYRSSHLRADLYGKTGWVVQTVMIDGHVSQGMVFCKDDFEEVLLVKEMIEDECDSDGPDRAKRIDAEMLKFDFTDNFNVQRWTTFYGGRDLGRPPCFLPDNKLKRAQNLNLPKLWQTHGDKEFEITELLDGIPIMAYKATEDGNYKDLPGMLVGDSNGLLLKRSGVGISIGDHDYEETKDSSSWAALRSQGLIDALSKDPYYTKDMVLSGVLCGVGISGNSHEISGRRFYVHSISEPGLRRFNSRDSEIWRNRLNHTFDLVPTISRRIRLSAFAENMDELVAKAAGDSFVLHDKHEGQRPKRKGLVFRAVNGSLSFKVISDAWLLDETERLRDSDGDTICRPGPKDCL
ncbi:hypothetical protein KVR01_010502 [Diaporthe batatas]|uniref:uncharacterized protein n=1 Tax=Diaporthe batatas TaxID=748121 RepID=UPI001D04D3DD|nr:uncharacterized protein KVR01_010502 [Diaporthe batatas]KAG8159865.1 hypothetical protein KVR01_010502 [Diaporthe batatas]